MPSQSNAQHWGVKTNLLYDATSTINLGTEFTVGKKQTLDLSGNLNLWTFSENRKMKHWLAQPEWRFWLCSPFSRSFFGVHAHAGQFNFGGMLPFGFSEGKMFGLESSTLRENRYEGWAVGGGISYGYAWIIGNHWNLEAEIGLGYAYLDYDRFACPKCGQKTDSGTRHYVGPTKAAISLVYLLK